MPLRLSVVVMTTAATSVKSVLSSVTFSRCVDTVESSSRLTAIFMVFISAITLTER